MVVFCEGEVSEPAYVKALKSLPDVRRQSALTVEIDRDPGVPMPLVERAIERARQDEVDECWCVFDVESPTPHPNLQQAIEKATRHGIRLAVSNPCFELWLILHLQEQSAHLTTRAADKLRRELDGGSSKLRHGDVPPTPCDGRKSGKSPCPAARGERIALPC